MEEFFQSGQRTAKKIVDLSTHTSCNLMDKSDLVKLVSSKTGLNEEMATLAVDTVIGFLKQKLPPELAGQLDGLLSADGGQAAASGILGKLGGLFGKKDS